MSGSIFQTLQRMNMSDPNPKVQAIGHDMACMEWGDNTDLGLFFFPEDPVPILDILDGLKILMVR